MLTSISSLDSKVAIVTGSSQGIGRAIAIELASLGLKVVVNYANSKAAAEEVVKDIIRNGGEAIAVQANIANLEDVKKLIDNTLNKFGRIDILVNNAGITRDKLLLRMKLDDWQTVIDLNLTGVFLCTQAVIKTMLKQKNGRIINVSSIVGEVGNPGQANYSAAKAGILGFTKSVAKEVASRGITVNAIAPGFIKTNMTKDLEKENVLQSIPLKRLGTPEEVAGLTRFLAVDPSAAYITGQVINIDGGMVMN
ncbi:3-oxoacyl-[acyl-carrier-protein] reductase [Candidatus Atelocyanobacterium thalassae]|uniref:3-oxoacyl-[acyl-carrier-protein] reductase n=1 Tax=Candidatus Atelocyanobacterium thalassae TaxID=713887 RepID=UPI00059BC082|nr:3-oxoacyl-[acyl-carrier-protein] reductase [Candidatus Atelocyanobacterium thalassa]MCH2543230.1 3-oxoacyl-[acyl-carrier-protein] reductase [Candidatus Atelocyanobacterium sp. ALOHA_A2.5_9]|tara:strand:- start:3632 stop:4387 length:756 start_codon:yes stop_codon:yes gene_type:complete